MTKGEGPGVFEPHLPDDVTVKHWFALYGVFFAAAGIPLLLLITAEQWSWSTWCASPADTFAATGIAIKLLGFALYLSLATTFLPLPTGWIAAALAMREVAVGADVWTTTLLVAAVGGIASTIANLNDYHLFTWMLRHHRIAAVRRNHSYQAAARWFARSPFFLLVVFNFIPIPVDVVRILATSHRYPRLPFAAANFIGRFVRYAVIAFITYSWKLDWKAPVALLVLAALLGGLRIGPKLARKLFARSTNRSQPNLSDIKERPEGQRV